MTIEVVRYQPGLEADWNRLVAEARNGLFLFDRRYVDYHAERFPDFSAIAYCDGAPAVLLPATMADGRSHVVSHAGLTFGGFILGRQLRGDVAMDCIDAILAALKAWGGEELTVKLIPPVFCAYPSEEVGYALWRRGFALVRRDLSTAIPLADPIAFNSSKRQAVAKARKAGLMVGEGAIDRFHALLSDVLDVRHGTEPVHSLGELRLLMKRFPDRIALRSIERDGEMLAGVLVYRYGAAWHTQYMAASEEGRKLGALDLVIASLIEEARKAGADWLSFGTSTTDQGMELNRGLLWQKESFGGRSITHDFMRGRL
jgi:hypothetical protein